MADYLVFPGNVIVEITETRRIPERVSGSVQRAVAGNLRTTQQVSRDSFAMKTRPYTTAEMADIRAAMAFGAVIAVGGTALGFSGAGTKQVAVEEGDTDHVPDDASAMGYQEALAFTLRVN